MTCAGLFGGTDDANAAAALVGGGAVATLFGVSMFSPQLVRPLASICGWPLEKLSGITGRLARENAVRKPGRTAVTAGALMIGLAVVVFVTVFAAGISASVGNAIDRNFQGDLVLQNTDGFSPISPGAGREAAKAPGVKTVSSLSFARRRGGRQGRARVGGRSEERVRRALARLGGGLAGDPVVAGRQARRWWTTPGPSPTTSTWATGSSSARRSSATASTPSTGTVKDNADLLGNLVVTENELRRSFGVRSPSLTFVKLEPGADADRRAGDDQARGQGRASRRWTRSTSRS